MSRPINGVYFTVSAINGIYLRAQFDAGIICRTHFTRGRTARGRKEEGDRTGGHVERPVPRRSPLSAALLAAVVAGCSGTPRLRLGPAEALASPMFPGVCSVFLTIANAGDGDDALVEARADLPGAITQLHAVRDGRMVQRDRLVVPAGGALELKPGGAHVMVFNLPKDGTAGLRFTLHLRFERSGELRTDVTVTGARADEERTRSSPQPNPRSPT